eukprot:2363020-Prorocentrum_lima.AAC.1
MTSSLVGSEMCIRDSQYSPEPGTRINKLWRVRFAGHLGTQVQNVHRQPVSYTHLTLPTICSV